MEEAKKINQRKAKKQWQDDEVRRLIKAFESKPDLWNPYRTNYYTRWVCSMT